MISVRSGRYVLSHKPNCVNCSIYIHLMLGNDLLKTSTCYARLQSVFYRNKWQQVNVKTSEAKWTFNKLPAETEWAKIRSRSLFSWGIITTLLQFKDRKLGKFCKSETRMSEQRMRMLQQVKSRGWFCWGTWRRQSFRRGSWTGWWRLWGRLGLRSTWWKIQLTHLCT